MPFFNSFHLDVPNASLRRGKKAIFLAPKAFRVLQYLVEHPRQLVSKDDLFRAVWPKIAVTDAALAVCLSEIRKALGDPPKKPRYIETVHRLGYRFIAPVSNQPVRTERSAPARQGSGSAPRSESVAAMVVGRDAEISELNHYLDRALNGERQIVFVTGEPGIGKTTLVEAFLEKVAAEGSVWIGLGQCIEQYGAGEGYLPLLDALGRLCREPGGGRLVQLLDKHAPVWLAQMPALLPATDWKELQGRVAGATRERMLRELADAIEAITAERPLVLRLEDLHWSDHSTLEWLGFLARRRETARLLVLGSYRPVEVIVRDHPLKHLKQELWIHRQCQELPLAPLSEAAVMEYLTLRFTSCQSSGEKNSAEGPIQEPIRKLAHSIYQRTDGNPLFMINVVDYVVERHGRTTFVDTPEAQLAEAFATNRVDIPPSIVQLIERNLERLNRDELAVLEAASVAGTEFLSTAIAAALERPTNEVEAVCASLTRQEQFLQTSGTAEMPDGTLTGTFRFLHALYRDVLYERVPPARRAELHRRIAERREEAYGEHVGEVAVELAYHYRRGGNKTKTVTFLELAGERAATRRAFQEAEQHYRDAIAVLRTLLESADRDRHEISLQTALGNAMAAAGRFAETAEIYRDASMLAERAGAGDALQIFFGLSVASLARGEIKAALAISDEMLGTARRLSSARALFLAHTALGNACHFHGELIKARAHFSEARQHYHEEDFFGLPNHPVLNGLDFRAATEWHLGYPDRCLQYAEEQLTLATQRKDTPSDALAYWAAGFAHRLRCDWPRMLQASEQCLRLSTVWKSPVATPTAKIYIAYARAKMGDTDGAADQIRQGLEELVAAKFYVARGRSLGWLAEVQLLSGDIAGAILSVKQGLEFSAEELLSRPELLRVRGELNFHNSSIGEGRFELAEQDFRAAIESARAMSAKSDELRATMSLARLLLAINRQDEARMMLAEIYNGFSEGFDTADLKEAKVLLDDLGR